MIVPGSQLGPYVVQAPLGAGGMGEVYRARDPRIGREVAVKVIPPTFASDRDRLRRFEQEARAAGALNHPNLLTVFELGMHNGTPYIATELLEGRTLRDVLVERKLTPRKAVEYALQIASGLAAAHEGGVIHRDLKPENIFITSEDRVKLLDFGLAKLTPAPSTASDERTEVHQTGEGVVLGTAGYMSPEQVRGSAVDHRSDIFSFGVVLYEMLAGAHPFWRNSSVETSHAIVSSEPRALPDDVGRALERIVWHMLEKTPALRFYSAKDVAYALESWSLASASSVAPKEKKKRAPEPRKELVAQRLTFRRGLIMSARFAPDGSIVYGAAWEEKPLELFAAHPATPESRSLGVEGDILSVSQTGELAVSLSRRYVAGYLTSGTLARLPMFGGAPRPICEGVQDAEWTRDGSALLIIRAVDGICRIELPIGNVIHQTAAWVSHPRLSPNGELIAFCEHPLWGDNGGYLVVIGRDGRERARSKTFWYSATGVAWTPDGAEAWVTGGRRGAGRTLNALQMNGKERTVVTLPGRLTLHDISATGEVLVTLDNARREVVAGWRGQPHERNLSWLDWSTPATISRDGRLVTIEETGDAPKTSAGVVYVRPIDGGRAVRIAEGRVFRSTPLSADGRLIAVLTEKPSPHIEVLPMGPGEPRRVECNLERINSWQFFPDGKRLLIVGNHPGEPTRLFELAIEDGGIPRQISPDPVNWPIFLSHDGQSVVALNAESGRVMIYASDTGSAREAAGCEVGDVPIDWSEDNRAIYVYRRGRTNVEIERVDVDTGARASWQTIRPADPAGIMDIMPVSITPDGQTYIYGYRRFLSDLYLLEGLL